MRHRKSDAMYGKMLGVFAMGIMVGSAITLLFTAQSGRDSGEKNRDYVRRKGEKLNDLQDKNLRT